ncbi:Uncharacterised protein [Mycobacteroides abscessus subsp. abscessus]|nr:Uncharacterised protein [Mycobacteroides abscessus subsp. abscessus]
MAMIEAIFRFFKMQIKHLLVNSIKFTEPLFRIAPKGFYTVNMTFTTSKFIVTVIYS